MTVDQRGSAVIEFAMVLPLVLALMLGIVEVAVVARSEMQLIHAAREGAREAAVSPDASRAVGAVRTALGPAGDRASISVSRPAEVGETARVSVRLPYRVAAPLFGGVSLELHATAAMRVER